MSKLRDIEEEMLRHDDPVVSVPELADELNKSTTHIRDQLRLLEREGVVASKDVGARATAWWHVGRVKEPLPTDFYFDDGLDMEEAFGTETPVQDSLADAKREAVEDRLESEQRDQGAPDDPQADESDVGAGLEDVDFPDAREREECVEAVMAAREFLANEGPALMSQIVTSVGPKHPVGYDVPEEIGSGERYRGAWWRHVVKPGLEALEDVEAPGAGGSQWRVEQ